MVVNGKLFEKGNKAAEKWTEEDATKLGNELIEWMYSSADNIFFEEFLLGKRLYRGKIRKLRDRFPSFGILIEEAKQIQENKIVKGGLKRKFSEGMSKFLLINNHDGYSEKKDINLGGQVNNPVIVSFADIEEEE